MRIRELFGFPSLAALQQLLITARQPTATMADDDTLNTTTTTGGGIIFDTYTDWWVFLTITVVCWSVVYGVVSKSMRDASERERAA